LNFSPSPYPLPCKQSADNENPAGRGDHDYFASIPGISSRAEFILPFQGIAEIIDNQFKSSQRD
jgi:hypothetical protein